MHRTNRPMPVIRIAAIAATLLLAACASPAPRAKEPPPRTTETRIAQHCARHAVAAIGADVATVHDVRAQDRERAAKVLGLDGSLQVVVVEAGSPADAAGLRPGDVVEAIDGMVIPTGPSARTTFLVAAGEHPGGPVLTLRRDGHIQVVSVPVRAPCTIQVLAPSARPA
ncbi:MAG: PDZ domain-containing protein [Burkholderiaceae bacterium]